MASKVKSICEEKIVPVIEKMGYEVVEVEYAKKSDGMNLTFYIDSDKGVQIEDCEKVSKAIDKLLEELNPTEDKPYILSVSSPGIDRPLKSDRDLKRNIGKDILITLFTKIEGNKKFEGTLITFDDKTITIKQQEEVTIARNKIAQIVPIIKF